MMWPTWDQAALTAVMCGILALLMRQMRPTRIRAIALPAALELTLMASLYSIWRLARELPLDRPGGAIERTRQINQLQQTLFFPNELSLQHLFPDHDWLARLTNYYYAIAHVPALVLFLVWLFVRHHDAYPRWRTG